MKNAERFELHYYFGDGSHDIDALVRNRCEAELLGIVFEAANLLAIDATMICEAHQIGGFRDIWKTLGQNATQAMLLLVVVQIILATIPLLDSENKQLEKAERKLSIEEKKLNIEKLKQELGTNRKDEEIAQVAETVGASLKIIKLKSNLYAHLQAYQKIERVGFSVLDSDWHPVRDEKTVLRSDFAKHILSTNRLQSVQDDSAEIEIISPVITEGRYKWKGLYNGVPIGFEMQDSVFRDAVLIEKISFQHGCKIICILVTHRELDELGDIKVTGYSVPTVLNKVDGGTSYETAQGKKYRHAKKLSKTQVDLFTSLSDS